MQPGVRGRNELGLAAEEFGKGDFTGFEQVQKSLSRRPTRDVQFSFEAVQLLGGAGHQPSDCRPEKERF
jgi:hypothetical protein